jgi:hypothetical protein
LRWSEEKRRKGLNVKHEEKEREKEEEWGRDDIP